MAKGYSKKKTLIILGGICGILLICGIVVIGGFVILGKIGIDTTREKAKITAMKSELIDVQFALESYYVHRLKYPDSLQTLVDEGYLLSTTIDGQEIEYEKIGKDDYKLSITLPDGEIYTITTEDEEGGESDVEGESTSPSKTDLEETDDTDQDYVGTFFIEKLKEGTGVMSEFGDTLVVHYEGWLEDGTKFDSSYYRGEPFEFTLGAGEVIEGWEQGLYSMKVGEKRKLTIPPHMAYGDQGAGPIPPNATLIFEIELIEIK